MLQILNPFEPFPDIRYTSDDGLLAVGGSLTESRLMEAYSKGIFPWYDESQPILWWCPDPRMVLFPHKLKVSNWCSMKLFIIESFRAKSIPEFQ